MALARGRWHWPARSPDLPRFPTPSRPRRIPSASGSSTQACARLCWCARKRKRVMASREGRRNPARRGRAAALRDATYTGRAARAGVRSVVTHHVATPRARVATLHCRAYVCMRVCVHVYICVCAFVYVLHHLMRTLRGAVRRAPSRPRRCPLGTRTRRCAAAARPARERPERPSGTVSVAAAENCTRPEQRCGPSHAARCLLHVVCDHVCAIDLRAAERRLVQPNPLRRHAVEHLRLVRAPRDQPVEHAVHGTVPCGCSAVRASRKGNGPERAERCTYRLRRPERKAKGQSRMPKKRHVTPARTLMHARTDLEFCARLNIKRGPSSSARVSGARDSRRPSSGSRSNTKAEANDRASTGWAADDGLCP